MSQDEEAEPFILRCSQNVFLLVANGTVGLPLLENIDYWQTLRREPSAMEQLYAIYANVIEMNDQGEVTNAKYAERRAAQWLRSYMDPTYEVSPPFEDWVIYLHDPPNQRSPVN